MEDLCPFQINYFSSSFQSGVNFFYIPIHQGYYAVPCHDFKENMQEEKTYFQDGKEYDHKQHCLW